MKFATSLIALLIVLGGCNSAKDFPPAENAFDAGREFIDGCLKGNFDKAAFYMLKDETNLAQLEKLEADYQKKTKDEKEKYAAASIIIISNDTIDADAQVINYKNSYDNVARKVKVLQQNGKWLVDFKYTFDGNL
ncbi:hypothetical protein [Foetidibacter luteolus]|uniref:hypothetical protein n=1 Tax=Foetidibacter luteolus TaxID=2608880 RepID=UPI00129ACDA9|nr:hypothetical protein [Foetidibacter luteolus]